MARVPNPEQQAAIDARGRVFLSAGAGTGKTSVLVERFVRAVCDEGLDIGSILEPTEVVVRTLEGLEHLVENQAACIYLIEDDCAVRAAFRWRVDLLPAEQVPLADSPL